MMKEAQTMAACCRLSDDELDGVNGGQVFSPYMDSNVEEIASLTKKEETSQTQMNDEQTYTIQTKDKNK